MDGTPQSSAQYSRFLRTISRLLGAIAICIGLAVLAGWCLNITALKTVFAGVDPIEANSALSFVLLGFCLRWMDRKQPSKMLNSLALAFALLVFGVALLTLVEYGGGWNFHIDQMLFLNHDNHAGRSPGRMPSVTAVEFLLLASSVLLLWGNNRRREPWAQLLALTAGASTVMELARYLFDSRLISGMGIHSTVAIHSAVAFACLEGAVLFARPESLPVALMTDAGVAGRMFRRAWPLTVVLPILVGWIGLEGQRAGYYGQEFGVALLAPISICSYGILLWIFARSLAHADAERSEVLTRQAYLASIVESSEDAIFSKSLDGVIQSWNRGAERLYGYTAPEIVGKSVSKLVPFDRIDEVAALLNQVKIGQRVESHETVRVRKHGTPVDVLITVSPLRDSTGTVIGASAIARDITERKQGLEAMHKSETQLGAVIQTAMDGIIIVNEQQQIEIFNSSAEQMFGYKALDVLGQNLSILIPKRFRAAHATHIRKFEDSKVTARSMTSLGTIWGLRASGDEFPIEASIGQADVAGKKIFTVILRDITARKRSEDDLIESKRRLELAQKAGKIGTFDWNIPTGKVMWTPELEALYGFSPGGFKGELETWKSMVHPEDIDRVEKEFVNAMRSRTHVDTTFRIIWSDKSVHWVSARCTTFYGENGKPLRMIGTNTDITEYCRLEEQFRHAQKMDAVGQLAGGIAHDFKNLLTVISGYSQLLTERLDRENDLRKYSEEIVGAAQRASELTHQLLAFSRQELTQPRVMSINTVLIDMEEMLRRMIGEEISLVVDRQPELGAVLADPGQLEHVIMTLAVNARDAMPRGGRLTISTADAVLDSSARLSKAVVEPGNYVMLAATDTGQGMDDGTRTRVFEPFFTTKERGKGAGMGLATVYGIVRQNEGGIEVQSEVGKGTTFKIYLPRAERPAEPHPIVPVESTRNDGSETVMIVEDDEAVRSLVLQVLKLRGYKLLEAGLGTDALAIADQHRGPIHLLIADVVMPNMRGPELANRFSVVHPESRTLFISGYSDLSIAELGLGDHRRSFLQKPFSPTVLSQKVREVLDSRIIPAAGTNLHNAGNGKSAVV